MRMKDRNCGDQIALVNSASSVWMPGFHNHLELTLDEPGTYLVSCLELCGVDHHKMSREFEVTAR